MNNQIQHFLASVCCVALLSAGTAPAQSTTNISFQGVLNGANGQPLPNGNYTLTFQFWAHPASTAASNRVGSAVTVPGVAVNGGVASTAIPVQPSWFDGQTRYLGIAVAGFNGGQELTPRVLVTAVPYALTASQLKNVFVNIGNTNGSSWFVKVVPPTDPWRRGHLSFDTALNPAADSVSASINGRLYRHGDLPPSVPGASFFKFGGTANTGEAVPYEFNAGSISLEVGTVGPGNRYSSAFKVRTLRDSFPDGAPEVALVVNGNGDVEIGNHDDYRNRSLVFRGPNLPANADSHQVISFQFAAAGSARIRGYRGNSWDTYLDFLVNAENAGADTPQRVVLVHSGGIDVTGTTRTTVLQITSDRKAKRDFAPVDVQAILAKVAELPVSSWAYTNAPTVRHLGPVAQDFHAAFGLGDSDKHIATIDADGVLVAAVQGLHRLLTEKEARLAQLESAARAKDAQITRLASRLTALETVVAGKLGATTQAAEDPFCRQVSAGER